MATLPIFLRTLASKGDSMEHPAAISERSRHYGIREGAFQAIMVGGGENYLSAFALLLHASAFQIGLLSALPQLVGTWAQLFSVKVLNRFHHRKALILVHAAEAWEKPWAGFVIIFLLAAAARGVSTSYLARIDESTESVTREAEFRLLAFLRRERGSNFQRFLVFSGLMHVSVLIAGPYFVVYLLHDLHFTYLQYTAWLAAGILGQFLTLKPWGLLGDRYGNKRVLKVTGLLVPFLPMLYVISAAFYYLFAVKFVGRVIWAGLSLGLQNYVFDAVRPEDRAKGVAVWNAVNALGWFLGAMIGSWLAAIVPSELGLLGWHLSLVSNLPFVFFISGVCRLIVSLSLLGTFRETRSVEPISRRDLGAELPLIKPLADTFGGGARRE